ncbi:MAG: MarR family transcriptional regulator [Acetobacteraceae bacterium]|nr:MarR family transcriptional regulator [Acetobacteraceae bacterium]
MEQTPPFHVRQVFGARLGRTNRQWRRVLDVRLQAFGLTEATWMPLVYLARCVAPVRQKDLADSIGVEGSTLVRLIDALDRAGLVERQTDGDRRVRFLHLTPRAQALVKQVNAVTEEIRGQVLAGIADEELEAALSVIDRIDAALRRLRESEKAED